MTAALSVLAALVLEDGTQWGDQAAADQVSDAEAIIEGPCRQFFQTRPRGGSKSTDAAGVALALLVTDAPPLSRSFAVAVDADQAGLLLDSIRGFVNRTPGFAGAVKVEARRVTAIATGASLEILTSDGPSAFGLRPWFVIVDEFCAWPDTQNHRTLWSALISALPKVADSRLVVITSAGSPSHWSHGVWQRALDSASWRTSAMSGPTPWWNDDDIENLRAQLLPSEFARLVLNEWTEPEDKLTTRDDVLACVVDDGDRPPVSGVRYVASLDIGLKRDRTALAVAHLDRVTATVVLDRLLVWKGSPAHPVDLAAVEAACREVCRSYRCGLVFDPHQAAQLAQGLRKSRIHTEEFTFSVSAINRLARTLYQLLRDHRLAIPNDPELIDELAAVRLIETAPGLYRIDHDRGRHDDRAIAVSMAAATLLERPSPSNATIHSAARRTISGPTHLAGYKIPPRTDPRQVPMRFTHDRTVRAH